MFKADEQWLNDVRTRPGYRVIEPGVKGAAGDGAEVQQLRARVAMLEAEVRQLRAAGVANTALTPLISLPITPVPAPRQVGRDAYNPSEAVKRYRVFKDTLREAWPRAQPLPESVRLEFFMPIPEVKRATPASKAREDGVPHREKPDADNLGKAFLDGLYSRRHAHLGADDSHVWHLDLVKRWTESPDGRIDVYLIGD